VVTVFVRVNIWKEREAPPVTLLSSNVDITFLTGAMPSNILQFAYFCFAIFQMPNRRQSTCK